MNKYLPFLLLGVFFANSSFAQVKTDAEKFDDVMKNNPRVKSCYEGLEECLAANDRSYDRCLKATKNNYEYCRKTSSINAKACLESFIACLPKNIGPAESPSEPAGSF